MEMSVLLVDDDQHCIDALKTNLQHFPDFKVVGEVHNAQDAIAFLQTKEIELVFLDIEMDGTNGLELAQHLKSTHPNIFIIFVTGHPGFALQSFEVHPIDYITKPINLLRLEKALQTVKSIKTPRTKTPEQKIGLKVEGGIRIVDIHDILYLEKQGRKVLIECIEEDSFFCNDSLQNLEMIFSTYGFYRVHQSFLVSIDKIKAIYPDTFTRSYSIELRNHATKLPLSRSKFQPLKELLQTKGIHIL